jgi:hypothetical protein
MEQSMPTTDKRYRRPALATILLMLIGLATAGCSSGSTEMRTDASGARFNTVSDLAQTADIVFFGRIKNQGQISRTPEPTPEVKGDTSPQLFAYSLVDVTVEEVIAERDTAAGLASKLEAGAPAGFAIIDPALKGVGNDKELKEENRGASDVPKSGDEGVFFGAYHNLGSAGDGFEIVGFASSHDKKNGKFETGIRGGLAGTSKPYDEIVTTSRAELKKGRASSQ